MTDRPASSGIAKRQLDGVGDKFDFFVRMGPGGLQKGLTVEGPNGLKAQARSILGHIKVHIGSGAERMEKKLSECKGSDLKITFR